MRTIIVYRSVLGTTKHYAQWLSDALMADMIDFMHVNDTTFDDYDVTIVTSGTYAGKMPLVGFLQKHWEVLQDKKVIVMAVGIAPAEAKESQASYEQIPEEIREHITYFKVPGNILGVKSAGQPSKEKLEPVISYVHGLV